MYQHGSATPCMPSMPPAMMFPPSLHILLTFFTHD
ncbi:hypothetical protein ECZG_04858 [Escherichia coli H378]|nr:hypothetical protein EAIG_05235 [Escherichia coli B108]OSK88383.1 hypothetical protein ECZG_04858 [Escherichia coli H378]